MYSAFLLSSVRDYFRNKEFHKIPGEVFRDLKCCVQRIKKGFCYRDIWNINSWFLCVISDMLDELKRTTHGFPSRFLKNDGSDTDEEIDRASAKWKAILSRMAFLFREANEETCQKKNPYDEEYSIVLHKFIECFGINGKWVKKKDGTRVFIHDLSDIPKYRRLDENYHRVEKELYEYRSNCLKKAMSMFVEYFNDLWD
ncbi:MAG: hypothetical protein HDT42_01295 [Ruminococcaceae bacterium]|nr:hypothetical protein [Oscillospiraceae bacterium]